MCIRDRLQELYSCGGRIPHLDGYRVYYASDRPKAAIVITNENTEGLFVRELSEEHHVCVKVIVGDREVYMMSSYFQYRDDIEVYITHWERTMLELHGKSCLLYTSCIRDSSSL